MSDIIDRITSRWTDEYLKQAAPVIAKIKELLAKGVPIGQAVNCKRQTVPALHIK